MTDHVITSERIFRQLKEMLYACPLYTLHVTCPSEVLRVKEQARGDRLAAFKPKPGADDIGQERKT